MRLMCVTIYVFAAMMCIMYVKGKRTKEKLRRVADLPVAVVIRHVAVSFLHERVTRATKTSHMFRISRIPPACLFNPPLQHLRGCWDSNNRKIKAFLRPFVSRPRSWSMARRSTTFNLERDASVISSMARRWTGTTGTREGQGWRQGRLLANRTQSSH